MNRLREKRDRVKVGGRVLRGGVVLVLAAIIVATGIWLMNKDWADGEEIEETREPVVAIVDENAGGHVSARVKELIMRLEDDLAYEGFGMLRVVVPFQKIREIDVYIKERTEYYKLSIDRESAVSAEDIGRMVRYLDEKELNVEYVDLRVEGKAFFK